jgi:hypothetical protein
MLEKVNERQKIILAVSFLLSGYAFLLLNPYDILNYIYLPFVLFFSIGGIYLFFSIDQNVKTMYFFKHILYYIGLFIVFSIIYFLLKNVLLYAIDISFSAVFLFYIVGFALIYKIFFENIDINISKADELLYVIQYFIFYIPCIFIIAINYLIDDAKNTTKTTYILGLLLILLMVIYFVIPLITKYMYKHDGILLIDKKTYLNQSILTITLKELKDKIHKSKPYLEGFKSITELNMHNLSIDDPKINKLELNILNPYNLSNLIGRFKHTYLGIPVEDVLYTYHYGISFWLYLDTNILSEKNREKALILTLGSRPSLYYDYNTRQLIIEITVKDKTFKQTRIYNSSNLLFQRWNHVVMNYVNGQFDLFINNEIVATQSNVSPYINDSDVLQVGSVQNTDLGGISNLKYYDQPLSLYKIKKVYDEKLFSVE